MTAGYCVIDVETTGVRRADRIVEIAVINIDAAGRPLAIWETLVDPERTPGPTRVHGIHATESAEAPSFRQIACELYDRLTGSILIGHHIGFDWWYLRAEFARCGVVFLREGAGECTAKGCRSLGIASDLDSGCAAYGLQRRPRHVARIDVECTWLLWKELQKRGAIAQRGQPLVEGQGRHRLPAPETARPRRTSFDRRSVSDLWDLWELHC